MNNLFSQHNWTAFNKQVAIIGNPNEFLVKSMAESFTAKKFKVHLSTPTVDTVDKIPSDVILYVVVVNTITDIIPVLIYLNDAVYEKQICPCLICENTELPEIIKCLPPRNIAKVFTRPVNMKEIIEYLDNLYHSSAPSQYSHKTILIVDDDPEYLRYIQQILRNDYKIYIANSGASALMLLSKHRVDLILLDYQMPILDGVKTMEALRSEPATADIPVMFLTGKQDANSVAQAIQLKPKKYLLKNTPASVLQQTIAEFFNKSVKITQLEEDTSSTLSNLWKADAAE